MKPLATLPARRLGAQPWAFLRAWAEGIDPTQAWQRFMRDEGRADARHVRQALRQLLEELGTLARAHGRQDIAALLRRDPAAILEHTPRAPSLDEFRAQQPADYYSESDLIELYQEAHGRLDARSAARRRQRLRERLVLALQWLERQAAPLPQPADLIETWLDERVSRRLSAAGLLRLADLVDRVRAEGARWHRGVPRLGAIGAQRIVAWLRQHRATLGELSDAEGPAAAMGAGGPAMAPLERFVVPPGLDGAQGSNRAPRERCALAVTTDAAALQVWLNLRTAGSHTWRAYRKEAERLLLWAVLCRRKALSSLDSDDCRAYQDFLRQPDATWVGVRNTPRAEAAWRPFEGPLSARSAHTALAVLHALFAWLVRQRYLNSNPWNALVRDVRAAGQAQSVAEPGAAWDRVLQWLDESARGAGSNPAPASASASALAHAGARLRAVVHLARSTGLPLPTLAAARVGWLQPWAAADGGGGWSLVVPGGAVGRLVLPEAVVQALCAYLAQRGLGSDLRAMDPQAPLVADLRRQAPLTPSRLYGVLAEALRQCADALAGEDPALKDRLRMGWAGALRGKHAPATSA